MLEHLASQEKVIGIKQSRKVLRDGHAQEVFLACDADPVITEPLMEMCQAQEVPFHMEFTMNQLGKACQITVGASVVAVIR